MPEYPELQVFLLIMVGTVVGTLIGWSIMGCILNTPRDILDFWCWLFRGGWRD